jgi:hypothetical protein
LRTISVITGSIWPRRLLVRLLLWAMAQRAPATAINRLP